MKFLIKLKEPHKKSGLTIYAVSKKTEIPFNTVKKYVGKNVTSPYITIEACQLADFYGLNWRSPDVIERIEDDDDTQQIEAISDEEDEKDDTLVLA